MAPPRSKRPPRAKPAARAAPAPWSARFVEPVSDLVQRFTASVAFDRRLAEVDIEASLAHARMLAACRVLSRQDLADIERGMADIRAEIAAGGFAAAFYVGVLTAAVLLIPGL